VPDIRVRAATENDLTAIAAIAIATGMNDEWSGTNPDYVRHLMKHGRVAVAVAGETVLGFGATQQIGTGSAAVTMLCDLFVDPAGHGAGSGRAMLAELWRGAPRRMTFSSLHANAMPLYTSFGLDAWWPLLYLRGDLQSLPRATGWRVEGASPDAAGQLEMQWTGADRSADYRGWAARPHAAVVTASRGGQIMAAGAVVGSGIEHLVISRDADDAAAVAAVAEVLATADPPDGIARVALPAPHPAVRPLLAAGWRLGEFDLFMATEPGLLDPRRAVPSPGQA
jgi:GNAT superfamily N-acetyltransferase